MALQNSTLAVAVNATDTLFQTVDSLIWTAGEVLLCEAEQVVVSSVVGPTKYQVNRGALDTAAQAHIIATPVYETGRSAQAEPPKQCILGGVSVGINPGDSSIMTAPPTPYLPNNWPIEQLMYVSVAAGQTFWVPMAKGSRIVESWFDVATPTAADTAIQLGNETGAGDVSAFGTITVTTGTTGRIAATGVSVSKMYAGLTGNSVRIAVAASASFGGYLNMRYVTP